MRPLLALHSHGWRRSEMISLWRRWHCTGDSIDVVFLLFGQQKKPYQCIGQREPLNAFNKDKSMVEPISQNPDHQTSRQNSHFRKLVFK